MARRSHWPISILSSLSALINMLMPLALVRVLPTEEMGAFKVFFLYAMILPVVSMYTGVINGLSYWAGRLGERPGAIRASSMQVLGLALAFLLVSSLASGPIADWLDWTRGRALVLALAVAAAIASYFYQEAAIATGRIWEGAIFNSAFECLRTAAILAVGLATRSVDAIFATHAGATLAKAALGYALGARRGLVGFTRDGESARAVWSYAMPVSVAGALAMFFQYADKMILSTFLAPAEFAIVAVCSLSVPPITILEHSVTRVLIPQLSHAFAEKRSAEAAALYRKAVEELSFLIVPAVAGMVVFASPIIHLLFTWQYASGTGYLMLAALGYLTLIIPYDSIPRARGESRWILMNFVAFSVPTLVACYLMARFSGPYGAVATALVFRLGMRAYGIWYIRRSAGWRLREFLPLGPVAAHVGVSVALGLGCLALRPVFARDLIWFAVCGAGFTAAYFGLFLARRRLGAALPAAAEAVRT